MFQLNSRALLVWLVATVLLSGEKTAAQAGAGFARRARNKLTGLAARPFSTVELASWAETTVLSPHVKTVLMSKNWKITARQSCMTFNLQSFHQAASTTNKPCHQPTQ